MCRASCARARNCSNRAGVPASPRFFDNPLDSGIQRRRVNWLNQVFQKAGCPALGQIGIRAEAAHRDTAQLMLSAQLFEQVTARGVGQSDITDEQIEGFSAGERACLLGVPGCFDLVSSPTQQPCENLAGVVMILTRSNLKSSRRAGVEASAAGPDSLVLGSATVANSTQKVAPLPSPALAAVSVPPCASVIALQIASPNPRPPTRCLSACWI